MYEKRKINVTDMDKITELISYRHLRKTKSVLIESRIKKEVEDCFNNSNSFSNIVEYNVLSKAVNEKRS